MIEELFRAENSMLGFSAPQYIETLHQGFGPVFLIGERNLALEGLRTLLMKHGIAVDCVATSAANLPLLSTSDSKKALVIFDVALDIAERREDINAFRLRSPGACIVVLLSRFHKAAALPLGELRANAIVDRNIPCDALMKTLRVAYAGYAVLSRVIGEEPIEVAAPRHANPAKAPGLSDREAEIIACIAEGQSNKVIARRFRISEATVKIHVRGILRKVDARNRTQAAVWALEKGFGSTQRASAY